MAEENKTVQTGNNTAGDAGTQERTFTQDEVNRIVGQRLSEARAKMPTEEELKAFREYQKTQKTDAEQHEETKRLLATAQTELQQMKNEKIVTAGECRAEFVEFVAMKVGAMDGDDFKANFEKFKKENPQYFGEAIVRRTSTSPNLTGGGATGTTNEHMNNILRNARK